MKIVNFILEIFTAPFNLLFRTKAITNPNKKVNPLFVFLVALLVTAVLVFISYYEVFMNV